ncbi:polyserase-2-like [Drosophila busckii]|uniref:polyserase-2-like n=1 Tax=Drosophila busckii TaxID=30019 RepID=UPI00083EE9A7|nr:polyserase-2-like [Drosophila busckii]
MQLQLLLSFALLAAGVSAFYVAQQEPESGDSQNPYARFVVSIQTKLPSSYYFGGNHRCVGTIVAPIFVLTSTLCLLANKNHTRSRQLLLPHELLIIAGAPNRQRPTQDTRILHVQSIHTYSRHDMALLRLQDLHMVEPNVTQALAIAPLPTHPAYVHSAHCFLLAWGKPREQWQKQQLTPLPFRLLSARACEDLNPQGFRRGVFCAQVVPEEPLDVSGDSLAAPLFCGNKLAGIVHRTVLCDHRYTSLFYSIYAHRFWIRATFNSCCR